VRQRFGEQIDAKYEQYLGALATVFRRDARTRSRSRRRGDWPSRSPA
jgi:hypothetical protein